MTLAVSFDDGAATELVAAAAWYEEQRPNLGARFVDEIERLVALLAEHPAIGAPSPPPRNARRVVVPSFPYALRYVVAGGTVRVLVVAHQARHR